MFVVRSYTVLNALVVEVTCWHGSNVDESHLVGRQQVGTDGSPVDVLERVAEVLTFIAREGHRGELDLTDDCTA